MALIRYQVLPAVVLPAHVVRQLPPVSVATTETFVPTEATVRARVRVDALVRRLALQMAAFAVAPRTSAGNEMVATPAISTADTSHPTMTAGFDRRVE
jgi:hypothetical protein